MPTALIANAMHYRVSHALQGTSERALQAAIVERKARIVDANNVGRFLSENPAVI